MAQQKQELYRRTLMPKIVSLNTEMARSLGGNGLPDSYIAAPSSYAAVSEIGKRFQTFASLLEIRAQKNNQPGNVELLERARALQQDCEAFSSAWRNDEQAIFRRPAVLGAAAGPLDAMNDTNKEEATRYHTLLEPSLKSWRLRALPLVPDYGRSVDYGAVSTSQDLMRVCGDITLIQQAYQQKQQNKMLEKRAAGQRR